MINPISNCFLNNQICSIDTSTHLRIQTFGWGEIQYVSQYHMTENEMDGQHQNLDRTGYGGAAEIGEEQTGMEECCAERVQTSDRGWIRTEQNSEA